VNGVRVQISKSKGTLVVYVPRGTYAFIQWPYPLVTFHDTISPVLNLPTTARVSSDLTRLETLMGMTMSQRERNTLDSSDSSTSPALVQLKDSLHHVTI
jgi:hypothetical protein